MWVTGQTLAVDLLTEVEQLLFGQAAFKVGAGIDARRYVALDVEAITTVFFARLGALSVPEMVETRTKQTGQRGERANVATQITAVFGIVAVGLDDHGHGVPAHVGAQALFNFQVAGRAFFFLRLNGIDVARGGRKRQIDAVLAGFFQQLF